MGLDVPIWPARVSKSAEIPTSAGTLVRLETVLVEMAQDRLWRRREFEELKKNIRCGSDPRDLIRSL
jgi:hypothetical protein